MKKLFVVALVAMAVSTIALAGTISAPFFNDGGAADVARPPAGNQNANAWLGVKNMDAATATVRVYYYNPDGSYAGDGTFTLTAQQGISWRPCATDSAEGPGSAIVNKTGTVLSGSVTLTSANNIVGRLIEIWDAGTSAYDLQ